MVRYVLRYSQIFLCTAIHLPTHLSQSKQYIVGGYIYFRILDTTSSPIDGKREYTASASYMTPFLPPGP